MRVNFEWKVGGMDLQRKLWRFVCPCAKRVMCRLTHTESYKLLCWIQFILIQNTCKLHSVQIIITFLKIFIESYFVFSTILYRVWDQTLILHYTMWDGNDFSSNDFWNSMYENVRVLCAEFLFIFLCMHMCVL